MNQVVIGMIVGLLGGLAATQVGLAELVPLFRADYFFLYAMAAGALVSLTRFRPLLWVISGLLCGVILVVACTPVLRGPANSLVRADPLERADAVVPLTSDVWANGDLNVDGELRLLKAMEIIDEGWTNRLVVTVMSPPSASGSQDVARQLKALRIPAQLSIVGPVSTTHDEAMKVAALARRLGWKRIIVVTSPLHTLRAAAVFRKTGLHVIIQPCTERNYDLGHLDRPGERIRASENWMREVVGREIYRWRGWN